MSNKQSQLPPLSDEEKRTYRARFKQALFNQLRETFRRLQKEEGLTQDEIARRLGVDKSLVCKRLSGDANLTLNTICDLTRAMGARLDAKITILKDLPKQHGVETYWLIEPKTIFRESWFEGAQLLLFGDESTGQRAILPISFTFVSHESEAEFEAPEDYTTFSESVVH